METLKTTVIVLLLLALLYGVYLVLNKPDPTPPGDLAWEAQATEPLQVDLGGLDFGASDPAADMANPTQDTTNQLPAMAPSISMDSSVSVPAPEPVDALVPQDMTAPPPPPTWNGEHLGELTTQDPEAPNRTSDSMSGDSMSGDSMSGDSMSGDSMSGELVSGDTDAIPESVPPLPMSTDDAFPQMPGSQNETVQNETVQNETGGDDGHRPQEDIASQWQLPSDANATDAGAPLATAETPTTPESVTDPGTPTTSPNLAMQTPEPATSVYAPKGPESSGGSGPSGPLATMPTEKPSQPKASIVDNAIQSAQRSIADKHWYEALLSLSIVYTNGDLDDAERHRLLDLLDPLAGKVIYSKEHNIAAPRRVERGESLYEIATENQVPWQLLANVNQIANPENLEPNLELKMIEGPFRAEINLQNTELTLYAKRLYAGRFPITLGKDPAPQPGDYRVYGKQPGRTYYAGDGRTIPIDDSRNPYGSVWIDLGGDLCIHGSSQSAQPGQGCISLSPLDANDLYGILSKGSAVTILR